MCPLCPSPVPCRRSSGWVAGCRSGRAPPGAGVGACAVPGACGQGRTSAAPPGGAAAPPACSSFRAYGFDPAVAGGAENDKWPKRSFQETVHIYSDTWIRLLSQVSAATSLAVVLPVPFDASAAARVGVHLREAVRKVNNGGYGDAVTEARKAIEAMDGKIPDWQAERQMQL